MGILMKMIESYNRNLVNGLNPLKRVMGILILRNAPNCQRILRKSQSPKAGHGYSNDQPCRGR